MRVLGSNHEASIDSILDSGELSINDRIIWRQREGHLKARVPVLHSEHRGIVLELTFLPIVARFSLQLRFDSIPARRFCSRSPHTMPHDCLENPGQRIDGYHKHRWSDITGDECCYVPDDISISSLEQTFYDFCAESSITFNGIWSDPPPAQIGLEAVG